MDSEKRVKHIGIVGCSAEGAALCYRIICAESSAYLGQHIHPEVSMHTHSLADYVDCLNRQDLNGVGEIMLSSARKLQRAGAEFLICPDNTIHQAFSVVEKETPLPWLHIADAVVMEAKEKGYQTLGILGTHWLVDSNVYPNKIAQSNMDWQTPKERDKQEISRIIMEELVYGVFKSESICYFQTVINSLKEQGCDAVILGCTEIPLIINDENSALPTLNSTRLLALAAVKRAIK
ncbi:amino acid racemase [Vibrio sp. Of7-15]|uniref:aspartate/glutamate racemase family protein n=1 Tax=Vibrio sp. Of7-15 TaxID=2724879 RepID=UPI001EF16427|nr:amino acid racemase [Vibrio sp. Of7-15]MCG7498050.1 amino acid racemase [Vibrio sp. Of7-15]